MITPPFSPCTSPEKRTKKQKAAIFSAWVKTLTDAESRKTENDRRRVEEASRWPNVRSNSRSGRPAIRGQRSSSTAANGIARDPVKPHVPALLHSFEKACAHQARLRELAGQRTIRWRARVAVNRVWQAIFGTGLVETAEDFGTRTPVPEYLDLLDWLAVDFMEHGWSHKHLIETDCHQRNVSAVRRRHADTTGARSQESFVRRAAPVSAWTPRSFATRR